MPLNIPNNSAFSVRHQEAFVDLDDQVEAEGKRLVVTANGRELKILPQRSKVGEFFARLFGVAGREIHDLRNYLASLPSQESIESHQVGQAFRKEIDEAYSAFQSDTQTRDLSNKGEHLYGETKAILVGQEDSKTPGTAAYVKLNATEGRAGVKTGEGLANRQRDSNLHEFASGVKKSPEEIEALRQDHREKRHQGQSLIGRQGGLGASKSAIIGTLKEEVRTKRKAQIQAYGTTKFDRLDRLGELSTPLESISEIGTTQFVEPQVGQLCLKHAIAAYCNQPVFEGRDDFLEYRNAIYDTMGPYALPDSYTHEDSDVEAVSHMLNAMCADERYQEYFHDSDKKWVIHEISIEKSGKAVDAVNDEKQLNDAIERFAQNSDGQRFIIRTGSRYGSGHFSLLNKNTDGTWTFTNSVGSSVTHGTSPAQLIGYERARNMPLYLWAQTEKTPDAFAQALPRQVLT